MSRGKCKFSDVLAKEFPMFLKTKNANEIECLTCHNKCINIANKGRHDILQHLNSLKHKKNLRSAGESCKLNELFSTKDCKLGRLVAATEATLAYHTVYHHFSYLSTDCTNRLLSRLFDDSKTASKIQCGRTKTQSIVDNVLAPFSLDTVRDAIERTRFIGICTDGSNHGSHKVFPVLIQYFDKFNGIEHKLIEVKSLKNETSDSISELIIETLKCFHLKDKCIAFGADNTNTNFGGIHRRPGENIFTKLIEYLERQIIGIGCGAHISNNSIHHAMDFLDVDVDSVMFKIYKHFSIYTVRVESLKEFCDSVEVDFKVLLNHSKTRWLSLFPVIERVLKMYEPLKSYFLSLEKPPLILKKFFENALNEALLFFVHSLAAVFHCNTAKMETEKGSLLETLKIVASMKKTLDARISGKFVPLAVKNIFSKNKDMGGECEALKKSMLEMYGNAREYLTRWATQYDKFKVFNWMSMDNDISYDDIQSCIDFLHERNVVVDDVKCFDQFVNLEKFISEHKDDDKFKEKLSHEKWVEFFKSCKSIEQYSEFEIVAEYFFAIPAHNANVERIFSFIVAQWTDERNRLLVDSIKSIAMVKYNFKVISCLDFFDMILKKEDVLEKIRANAKYQYERRNLIDETNA